MNKFAIGLGLGKNSYFKSHNPSIAELEKQYKKIKKLLKDKSSPEEIYQLVVYVAGHGTTDKEKQQILLNSSDPSKVAFNIQAKLSLMAKTNENIRVLGIFDLCRVSIKDIPVLCEIGTGKVTAKAKGRGVGDGEMDGDYTVDRKARYFHVQSCQPGGIAPDSDKFTKMILKFAKTCISKEGHILTPRNWSESGAFRWTNSFVGGAPWQMIYEPVDDDKSNYDMDEYEQQFDDLSDCGEDDLSEEEDFMNNSF